jgi:hypothetical protein
MKCASAGITSESAAMYTMERELANRKWTVGDRHLPAPNPHGVIAHPKQPQVHWALARATMLPWCQSRYPYPDGIRVTEEVSRAL